MKIAIDSEDLPAASRLDSWRGMLCDTYMGIDCRFPDENFRSVIEGVAVGHHTITRITSSRHAVDRSPTLIKRDGLELVFFGMLLAGRATNVQAGREAPLERGVVVVSDTSRPLRTYVSEAADILWLGVPKKSVSERLPGIEDLVSLPLRPARPVDQMALALMHRLDGAWDEGTPQKDVEQAMAHLLDLFALSIASTGLARVHAGPRSTAH